MLGTQSQSSALHIGVAEGVSGGSDKLPQCSREYIHIDIHA